jgi:IMP dehydrogenase
VKAFVAGADAVMLGGMLAGTDETPGNVVRVESEYFETNPTRYKAFRGMASREAAQDFLGGQADWKTAEGVEMRVAAKGPVRDVVADVVGGIRSGMTYCGANSIEEIRVRGRWKQITAAGAAEGRAHGEGRL